MKALEVTCPHCKATKGVHCYVVVGGFTTGVPLGHAHGARSRLVAIRSTLASMGSRCLDDHEDLMAVESALMEALS